MSNNWAVRSKGKPYLIHLQDNLDGMDPASIPPGDPASPSFSLLLEVAIQSVPTQNASADEVHRLFGYQDGSGTDLLTLGLTPSGRLVGLTPGGGVTQSAAGVIVADGITRTWALTYFPAGFATIAIDGNDIVFFHAVAAASVMPSDYAQFMLFNGLNGLTRCVSRIRKAQWFEAHRTITWAINEGNGPVLRATTEVVSPGVPFVQNFDLTAHVNSPYPNPPVWGPFPGDVGVGAYYEWVLSTAYERVPDPTTVYERTQI